MSQSFEKAVARLRRLGGQMRHAHEQAEARAAEVSRLVRRAGGAGRVGPALLLGGLVCRTECGPSRGPRGGARMAQAALSATFGLGVVFRDGEGYGSTADSSEDTELTAEVYFRPFERCKPALRALLLAEAEPLLERFLRKLS